MLKGYLESKRWRGALGMAICAVVIALVVCSCAPAAPTPAPAPTPTPAVHKWVGQGLDPTTGRYSKAFQWFANLVEERTDGRIDIDVLGVGEICSAGEMFLALSEGAMDIYWTCTVYQRGILPECEAENDIPFGYRNAVDFWATFHERGVLDIFRDMYAAHNIYYLIPVNAGPSPLGTKIPVRSPADVEGLKIRTSGMCGDFIDECGGATTWISTAELYTAVALGTIDGAITACGTNLDAKLYEVYQYWMWPPVLGSVGASICINMDSWNELSDLDKAIVHWCAAEAEMYHANVFDNAKLKMKKEWIANGGTIIELSPEEENAFREVAMKAWEKRAAEEPRAAKVITIIKDYLRDEGVIE